MRSSLSKKYIKNSEKERIKSTVLQAIEDGRDGIVNFLQKLVSIPSVTGEEKRIQDFIAKKLEGMGLEADVWEPDWDELRKHPGYIEVDQGYESRPNVVGRFRGKSGRSRR